MNITNWIKINNISDLPNIHTHCIIAVKNKGHIITYNAIYESDGYFYLIDKNHIYVNYKEVIAYFEYDYDELF